MILIFRPIVMTELTTHAHDGLCCVIWCVLNRYAERMSRFLSVTRGGGGGGGAGGSLAPLIGAKVGLSSPPPPIECAL